MSVKSERMVWKANQCYMREYEHIFEGQEAREKYGDCVVLFEGVVWILLSTVAKIHHDHKKSDVKFTRQDIFVKVFDGEYLKFNDGVGLVGKSTFAGPGEIYVRLDRVIYYKNDDTVFKTIFNMMRRQRWLEMFFGDFEAVHNHDIPRTAPVGEKFQPILPMPPVDGYRKIVPNPAKRPRTTPEDEYWQSAPNQANRPQSTASFTIAGVDLLTE